MADKQEKQDKQPARSPQEIEADIASTRDRLSRTVDELAYRFHPATLMAKGKAEAQVKKQELVDRARGTVLTPEGDPRLDNIAKGLGGVAAVSLSLGMLRRTFNKR